MSFDQQSKTDVVTAPQVSNDTEFNSSSTSPILLNEMLQNKELLTCYKCKETFDKEEQEHSLDSNNILLGIILNKRTPSSICLKCLSLKMMYIITEQIIKYIK